jgi:allene oxide cyclase
MSRYLIVLAVAAVAVAVIGVVQPAASATQPKSSSVTKKKFKATAVVNSATNVDNPPSGDSQGDIIVFTQRLYRDSSQQDKIGSDQAYCVRTIAGKARVCTAIFYLRGGTITITGPESTEVHSLAITGGTGTWRGARGEIVLRPNGPVIDHMTFHVELG